MAFSDWRVMFSLERRTELMRRRWRVVVFRYEDVRDRPSWVAAQIHALLTGTLSA